ncbi:hypothetical protein [Micromonospora sp. WMMD1082]|uniref:hypothetical protein n=1 Tax=Micromonospora sp. WMMD1082 TaxID=3016104 RepID=UPI0024169AA2|nr:hypothetical protein [Micromonospora sp. WMMD1082]MDG4796218.1 hypothetical protein [Micromonospora sp. WMMD1082]
MLPPVRYRFAEADHEQYGSDWWTFDEAKLGELRARELMAIDKELREALGLNTLTSLEAFLRGESAGSLAVAWLGRRLSGVVESLADFDPLLMLMETEIVKPEGDAEAEADADPPATGSSESPAATPEE